MKLGLFLPSATNGQVASTTTPQFEPTFDNILKIVSTAEHYGIEFGLALAKLHGFGGPSRFWDSSLDALTLVAGLLARTSKIKLFGTAPILAVPPAIAARAASTIDSISPGRFGINIVTGWQRAEYETMGLWPGEGHYANRYAYATEYVAILKQLWATGRSDFQGQFFKLNDCRVEPLPRGHIDIVSAGQSDAGLAFAAENADYSFIATTGTNDPSSVSTLLGRMEQANAAAQDNRAGSYPLVLIVGAETDEAALARWEHYNSGVDEDALAWAKGQAADDKKSMAAKDSTAQIFQQKGDAAMRLGRFIGSYASIAAMLDRLADMPQVAGAMLAFADWFDDVEAFGERIQPLMKSRTSTLAAAN